MLLEVFVNIIVKKNVNFPPSKCCVKNFVALQLSCLTKNNQKGKKK